MSETAPAPTTSSARLGAGAVLLAAVVGAVLLVRRPDAPPPRPEPGDVLLAESAPLAPLSRRLRVKMPCTIHVDVGVPAGAVIEASLGPPQPVERSADDVPDPELARAWTVAPGDPAHDEVVLAPGLYVLRLVPRSGAEAGTMSVTVRALPP